MRALPATVSATSACSRSPISRGVPGGGNRVHDSSMKAIRMSRTGFEYETVLVTAAAHLYTDLPLRAVSRTFSIAMTESGGHMLPSDVRRSA